MALYGWALRVGVGIRTNKERGTQLLQQSKHVIARAYCLLFGIGHFAVQQDREEAYRLLRTECETSDPHVQYLLGLCFDVGYGCKMDKAHAFKWYEGSGNHLDALNNLAFLLDRQYAPIADRHRAIALLRQSAMQGYAVAQFSIGYVYECGKSGVVQKDIEQAKHWYSLSAEEGNEDAVKALNRLAE
eukprot:TRINITY_DN4574_c0_g1_i1.p1 TRINITY_DN4574_c0_g1~~TRINITY_DN4574_c0_g1_i1.p1  ORF type:complete len:195 (-),score=35.60 TRINITY_DN4574_c0_g1_i1:51-611(-)